MAYPLKASKITKPINTLFIKTRQIMKKIICISLLFTLFESYGATDNPNLMENNINTLEKPISELLFRFVSGAEFDATIYFGDENQKVTDLKRVFTFYSRQYQLLLPLGTRVLVITYAPIPTGWELLASLMTGDLDIPEQVVCHYFTVQSEGFSTVDYWGTYTYPAFHISNPNVFTPLFNSEDNHVSTSGTCQWPQPVYKNLPIQE